MISPSEKLGIRRALEASHVLQSVLGITVGTEACCDLFTMHLRKPIDEAALLEASDEVNALVLSGELNIGLLQILHHDDHSISAVCGLESVAISRCRHNTMNDLASVLKCRVEDVLEAAEALVAEHCRLSMLLLEQGEKK